MIKYALCLGIFLMSIPAQAMQEKEKKIRHKDRVTTVTPYTIEERIAYGSAFIGNIDRVLYKNGFASVEKNILAEVRENLSEANLADDEELKAFFKYAKYGTLALKGKATEETFNEQIFCLGKLCLMAAECTVHNNNKKIKQKKVPMSLLTETHTSKEEDILPKEQIMPSLLEDSVE